MNEHGASDNNEDYLKNHPNAEADKDRANTAAYARKKIEDLIEIAKANGQRDIEGSLNTAADAQEKQELAEYDFMQGRYETLVERFSQAMIEIAQGVTRPVLLNEHIQTGDKVNEAYEKFMKNLEAHKIFEIYGDRFTGLPSYVQDYYENEDTKLRKDKISLSRRDTSAEALRLYAINFPGYAVVKTDSVEGSRKGDIDAESVLNVNSKLFVVSDELSNRIVEDAQDALEQ